MFKKILTIIITALIVAGAGIFFFKYCWVFGEGVKAGELNYITYKGYIFKTYEGRLIQSGFRNQSTKGGAGLSSNEFTFSVSEPRVAEQLMRCSGKFVELHYKEYNGALPWRGMSEYVVDSIIAIGNSELNSINALPLSQPAQTPSAEDLPVLQDSYEP